MSGVTCRSSSFIISSLKLPRRFEVTTPAKILSLTFRAVRAISIIGSTDTIKPIISIGRSNAPNTISAAKVAPPPTPATPKDETATTTIIVPQTSGSDNPYQRLVQSQQLTSQGIFQHIHFDQ